MALGRNRSWLVWVLVAGLALLVGPGVASAHEITGSRFDAPLPLPWLLVGAGATVALTALWLARSDQSSTSSRTWTVAQVDSSVARILRVASAGLFFLGFLATLALGAMGRQVAAENFATVFTWPVWFRGVALLTILVGTPWQTLSPWRTLYRVLCRIEGDRLAVLGSYPSRIGHWPALAGFLLLIGIVENLTVIPRSPTFTAVLVSVYALVMLVGAVAFGPTWFERADPLEVFYRLFSRVSGIRLDRQANGTAIQFRPPWQGCRHAVDGLALVAFVVAAVYTVSFDGFTETRLYQTVLFEVRDALGTGPPTSILLYLLGLSAFVSLFIGASLLGDLFGATDADASAVAADGGVSGDWRQAALAFAPTVLPIAAAYEVAHNYPYVVRSTAQLLGIVAEPLGVQLGSVNPLGWLSLPLFWGSQAVLIVIGHVFAVIAAHRVALDRYPTLSAARRGHVPLVVVMIGYTVLSLWIISQPVVSS